MTSAGLFGDLPTTDAVEVKMPGAPRLREPVRDQIELRPVDLDGLLAAELKLPRFRGHPTVWVFGVHNGKKAPTLCAGVPPTDDRAGSSGSHSGAAGEGVRTVGP